MVQMCAILEPHVVTDLLEFLYKWMPLHLVYTVAAMLASVKKREGGSTK